jgi:cytochrome c oxidase cbb3-type subunit III
MKLSATSMLVAAALTLVAGATVAASARTGAPAPKGALTQSQAAQVQTPDAPPATPPSTLSPQATEGAKLFVAYNCGDCHGAGGSGAMGPSLADNRWRFGGTREEISRSITDGRPEGMPAWGPMIPRADVQKLVAYIESLGAGKELSTENFTGGTVERAGH